MSRPRTRPRFMPDVVRGDDRDEVNADFRRDVERFGLVFRCDGCVYVDHKSGRCTVGWPNEGLSGAVDGVDERGQPVFCKAFEADGS